MRSIVQDVRYGLRLMRRTPGFTAAAVATLALGIGANSAIFSVVNTMSLKPLPYHDPSRVAFVLGWDVESQSRRFSLSIADFLDLQRQARSFEHVAAYSYLSANLTGGDIPERVQAYRVTPNTFAMLGVAPALGRALTEGDAGPGRDTVAVLSNGLWRRRFGADPSVIGRRTMLNGRSHEIVAVMPPRFEYPVFNFKGDLWTPWTIEPVSPANRASSGSTVVVARIRPGISYSEAQSELDTIMRRLAADYPDTNRTIGARLTEMARLDDEQAGPAVLIVVVTVAVVLLLACANVANLLLARGVSRNRELAVRAAVGASRWHIVRQLLIEGLLLAIAGGAAGAVLAGIALSVMRASLPDLLLMTQPNIDELGLDRTTLLFTLLVSCSASLVFGAVPAWRAAKPKLQEGLKESAAASGSLATRRLRTSLVVGEVALSTMLLVVAGLLVRSYVLLQHVSPGFDPRNVLTLTLTLPEDKYPNAERRRLFYGDALDRIGQVHGIRHASFVNVLPFSTYDRRTRFVIDGSPVPEAGQEPAASYRIVSPAYFETMRIPVLAGRGFDARDGAQSATVAVVNRALARRFFGEADPIGRRIRFGLRGTDAPLVSIVGVIGDVRHSQLTEGPVPEVYVPLAQAPPGMAMLAARTAVPPDELIGAVRSAIQSVDPSQPVYHVKSMSRLLGDSLLPRTSSATLMTVFSGLALLLAAIGIYGVVSYGVTQQMREFGVRIALGATPWDLLRLVAARGLMMVGAGVAFGALGALALSGLLEGALYGIRPTDSATYAVVIAILSLVGLAACVVPAWRAARTEPLAALRVE
jgi:putative ABC transport system permease protein